MKKIEPVAWIDDGGMLFCNDGIIPDGTDLYTDDALQAVAEAVLIKLQEAISKRQILHDETAIDRAYNRGLDAADAIVGDLDVDTIINQLKGK